MIEYISKKIYAGGMIVLGVSTLLLFAVSGFLPFGITAGWSDTTLGSSLVFTQPDASAHVGSTVVGPSGVGNGVVMFSVTEVVKESGATYYKALQKGGSSGQEALLRAGEYGRVALFSVPVLGVWVKALEHTLGLLALIGIPLMMLGINGILLLGSKFVMVASFVESGAKHLEKNAKHALRRGEEEDLSSVLHEEKEVQEEYVTILKPFGRRYGI